jgi:hypothetical protein
MALLAISPGSITTSLGAVLHALARQQASVRKPIGGARASG